MMKISCPCGSKKVTKYCCQMYLSGKKKPETAEKLMRSRYTAFVQGDLDYLIATLHPDQRKNDDKKELALSIEQTHWLGLTIISTTKGKQKDNTGIVEFEAIYQIKEPQQLHERSQFLKIDAQWFYVDGEILSGTIPKPNALCWCGSNKKYKKCHGE